MAQVCGADWSPSGLLARVAADGAFHALIDTGAPPVIGRASVEVEDFENLWIHQIENATILLFLGQVWGRLFEASKQVNI